jgi:hypothetical protein
MELDDDAAMIMYAIEIVEGKDKPPQRPRDPNERLGNPG